MNTLHSHTKCSGTNVPLKALIADKRLAPRRIIMMKLISRKELGDRMDRGEDLKLIFVLDEWYFQTMRIPGSLNIPCSPELLESRDALEELGPDDQIVVYCSSEACYASILVYYLLRQRGYKNVSRYAGGLLDWIEAGYPMAGTADPAKANRMQSRNTTV
jgi:rhodanese-related sulfurtransferase